MSTDTNKAVKIRLLDDEAFYLVEPMFPTRKNKEITKILQDEGYTNVGGKPVDEPLVSKFLTNRGLRRYKFFTKKSKAREKENLQILFWNIKDDKDAGMSAQAIAEKYNDMGFLSKRGKPFVEKTIYRIINFQVSRTRPKSFYRIEGKNPITPKAAEQLKLVKQKTQEPEKTTDNMTTKDMISLLLVQQDPDLVEKLTKEERQKLLSIALKNQT